MNALFHVRINGQVIGPLSVEEIDQRSARWTTLKATVEVAVEGTTAFIPLQDFLGTSATAPVPAAVPSPAGSPTPSGGPQLGLLGPFTVRVGTQEIGPVTADEIRRRSASWLRLRTTAMVSEAGSTAEMLLPDFLARLSAASPPSATLPSAPLPAAAPSQDPRLAAAPSGPFLVQVGNQQLGTVTAEEARQRSGNWLRSGMPVTLREVGSHRELDLQSFLSLPPGPTPSPAVQPPASQSATPAVRFVPPSRSWWIRAPLLAVTVFCLLGGPGFLAESARTSIEPYSTTIYIPGPEGSMKSAVSHLKKVAHVANGFSFAVGVMFCLAGLLALNRALPGATRHGGPIDRGLERLGVLGGDGATMVPFLAIAVCVVWLAYLVIGRTDFHWSATAAAEAFGREVPTSELAVTGNIMYAKAITGPVVHMAHFTPALARALDRAQLSVGGLVKPHEYPLPGITPIAVLVWLAVFASRKQGQGKWRPAIPGAPDTMAARAFVGFALLNLYVTVWLVSGEHGVFFADGLHPEWVGMTVMLLAAGLGVIAALHRKIEVNQLPYATRASWLSLYFAASLAAPVWSYYFSGADPTSPFRLWLLAYVAAGAACWVAIEAAPDGGRP